MRMTDEVRFRDDGGIRVVTLNRPHRHNAFTADGYRTLAGLLAESAADDDVRVVMLTGAGTGFCSGVDLAELAAAEGDLSEFDTTFHALLRTLTTFPKPLLAVVHGAAVGFGFTVLLHCDIVVVAQDARMCAPFAALGTAPEAGSSHLLPRLVGPQRAAELLLTGRWLTAEEAVQWGLATRVVTSGTALEEGLALARSIAEHPPAAVAEAKRLLLRGRSDEIAAAITAEGRGAAALAGVLGGPRPGR